MSIGNQTGHSTKPVYSIPPTNQQPIRVKESMGRTISLTYNLGSTQRLGPMANDSICSPQQQMESNHRVIAQLNPIRIWNTPIDTKWYENQQQHGGTENWHYEPKKRTSNRSSKQNCQEAGMLTAQYKARDQMLRSKGLNVWLIQYVGSGKSR
jgi:hypothetical protein